MNIRDGSRVYYRMHKEPKILATGFSMVLPKVSIGTVVRILGRSSVVLKSNSTGALLYRIIIDLAPFIPSTWNYELDFLKADKQYKNEQRGGDLEVLKDPHKYTRQANEQALKEGEVGHQPRRRNDLQRRDTHLQEAVDDQLGAKQLRADAEAVDNQLGERQQPDAEEGASEVEDGVTGQKASSPLVIATSSDEETGDEDRVHRRRSSRLASKRRQAKSR